MERNFIARLFQNINIQKTYKLEIRKEHKNTLRSSVI